MRDVQPLNFVGSVWTAATALVLCVCCHAKICDFRFVDPGRDVKEFNVSDPGEAVTQPALWEGMEHTNIRLMREKERIFHFCDDDVKRVGIVGYEYSTDIKLRCVCVSVEG